MVYSLSAVAQVVRSTINILKFRELLRVFNLDFSKFRGKYVYFACCEN